MSLRLSFRRGGRTTAPASAAPGSAAATGGAATGGAHGPSSLDRALLPFFGPAQIHSVHTVGTVSHEAVEREGDLRVRYERVVGPDGHPYVVERPQ